MTDTPQDGRYPGPVGALIEIVEKRTTPPAPDSISEQIVVPNEIRINGQPLYAPRDSPVRVHEIALGGDNVVLVTMTVFARRVIIGAEDPETADV